MTTLLDIAGAIAVFSIILLMWTLIDEFKLSHARTSESKPSEETNHDDTAETSPNTQTELAKTPVLENRWPAKSVEAIRADVTRETGGTGNASEHP